jgi:NaMN:DMB phosphoribosyltransferase
MRPLVFAIALTALPAQADLYRWVDRESGSVKFSSYPPPWFGDPERERGAPAVEVIPFGGPGAPAKPVATPEKPSPAANTLAALEARWAGFMQFFATLPATTDFNRAGAGIQQQLEAYQALSAELDRLDPAGAQRRRAQEAGVFETMRRGLEAQLSTNPPATK